MPDDLRGTVAGLAIRERRSFNSQVLTLVEAGLLVERGVYTPARDLPAGERAVIDALHDELDASEVDAA